MKKLLKFLAYFILSIILYVIVMLVVSYIPVNRDAQQNQSEPIVDVYLNSNGVHTDLVVPYKTIYKDWSTTLPAINVNKDTLICNYLSVGWGDKGFYLDIEEWSDLDFKTAFNAAFGLSESAMHVTFLKTIKEGDQSKKIKISADNYKKLIRFIEDKFATDSNGNYKLIPNASYYKNDVFYDANGRYSFYYTCNTWANQGLKKANLKAALWTLHEGGIFYHYK